MSDHDRIAEFTKQLFITLAPKTQEDCCAIAAHVTVAMGLAPQTDRQFIDAAAGLAAGLFGPAFKRADYAQKVTWIDMAERALRDAAHKPRRRK